MRLQTRSKLPKPILSARCAIRLCLSFDRSCQVRLEHLAIPGPHAEVCIFGGDRDGGIESGGKAGGVRVRLGLGELVVGSHMVALAVAHVVEAGDVVLESNYAQRGLEGMHRGSSGW